MYNVLIIDDDRKIRDLLQQYLGKNGINADCAESADEARAKISQVKYDLLVVDVMMPKETGIQFTKHFKPLNPDMPIIILTAMGSVENRIEGLEAGADDYLAKPFEPRELYLRITKLAERFKVLNDKEITQKEESIENIIKFGDCIFNLQSMNLTKSGNKILLSTTEQELLKTLVENINKPLSRYDLAEKFNGISERSIDVQINRLRRKIENDSTNPVFIQAVWGTGYVFRDG